MLLMAKYSQACQGEYHPQQVLLPPQMLPLKVMHPYNQDDQSDDIEDDDDHQNVVDNEYDDDLQGGLTHRLPSACAWSSESWSWEVILYFWNVLNCFEKN